MSVWRRARTLVLVLPLACAWTACGPGVDLRESVELVETSSGWFDAGIVDGKNKIVPSVTFRLRKDEGVDLDRVALNVIFRHPPAEGATTEDEWDDVFVQSAAFTEGNQTPPLVVRTEKGYTGEPPQSRLDLLQHSQFRDVYARVFVKYGSEQWVELGIIDVERRLLTR